MFNLASTEISIFAGDIIGKIGGVIMLQLDSFLLRLSCFIAVFLGSFVVNKINVQISIKMVLASIISLMLFLCVYGIYYFLFLK